MKSRHPVSSDVMRLIFRAGDTDLLDLSLLTRAYSHEIFVCLPEQIETAIDVLPETSARFLAALKFCWYASGTPDTLFADEPKATRLREAFLRASLSEFVSIEDTLKRDLEAIGITGRSIKIFDLRHPLLHIMRVLRNLEIHLTSHQLSHSEKDVVMEFGGVQHQTQTTVWTIDPLTIERFCQPRRVKSQYSPTDIEAMVHWFNAAQRDWGVNDLLFRAICEWASAIVRTYSLRAAEQSLDRSADRKQG